MPYCGIFHSITIHIYILVGRYCLYRLVCYPGLAFDNCLICTHPPEEHLYHLRLLHAYLSHVYWT